MMKKLLVLVIAACITTPAHAQLEREATTGSRFLQDPNTVDPKVVRKMTKDFGKCIFDGRAKQSLSLLAVSDYRSIDYSQLGEAGEFLNDKKFMEFCLRRAMTANQRKIGIRISNSVIRSALVEEAYLDTYKKRNEPIVLPADAPEVLPNRYFVAGPTYDDARAVASFSDCVVYNAPAEAHAIVHTKPASKEERQAINAIVPALGACLSAGSEMALDVPSIRAFVADGLWARSHYGSLLSESTGTSEEITND
ncbi:MAG: hypothetical protein QNJ15_04505 [Erythrobacter sp.]|nr:hypothetical protein [Erythrobacter sp.]